MGVHIHGVLHLCTSFNSMLYWNPKEKTHGSQDLFFSAAILECLSPKSSQWTIMDFPSFSP
jgi:hypothetical protein